MRGDERASERRITLRWEDPNTWSLKSGPVTHGMPRPGQSAGKLMKQIREWSQHPDIPL